MDEIHFVDTTIRDGHQSLWAERMSTGMMLPIAKRLDDAGFLAIELLVGLAHQEGGARAARGSVGAHPAGGRARPQHAAAPDRRPRQHVRLRSALHVRALHRAHGRQRHPAGAHLGAMERSAGLEIPRRGGAQVRARSDRQPDLFGLAGSHRRILRGALPPGRDAQAVPALPQGSGRPADARAHPHAGAGRARQQRRHPGRAAQPLHHRARAAGGARGRPARHPDRQYGRAAARRRRRAALDLQRRAQSARHRLPAGDRRGGAAPGHRALHGHRQARGLSDRACRPNTTTPPTSIRCRAA